MAAPAAPAPSLAPISTLLLGMAGGALFAAGHDLRARARAAVTVGGLALIGAAAHRPLSEAIRRAGARRRSGRVELSVVVPFPVEVVFRFLRDFENWPRFITGLREVRDYEDGRSHWSARTPRGGTLEWDSVTTKYVPNAVVAWENVGDAPLRMSALLRFAPDGGATCLTIAISYQVLRSNIGDSIAVLMHPWRRGTLTRDLRRLSSVLRGYVAAHPSVSVAH